MNNMLQPGYENIRNNVQELTQGIVGPARQKAIKTLAAKHSISEEEARFKQALVISYQTAKKKKL